MDGQDGVAGVIFIEEKRPELGLLEFLLEGAQGPVEVVYDFFAFLGQLQQDFYFFPVIFKLFVELEVFLQLLFPDLQGLELFLVVPGFRAGQLTVYIF
ncbi:MAG: hypothetical protein OP8BY_1537 [Candidatus Saccharicenans subterraneus]|uniref:Uncharacterized protein n=1 Tax=Candidatus Saccharicenans subterraneus TaxID=2508984 RepID=A0A3E2BJH9_9BACT|nr:MAG: hypothetical protein OP8BY_1537 [Candidatus Saccharicenans subterraneum]